MQVSVHLTTVLRSGGCLVAAARRVVTASPAAASLGAVKSAAVSCLATVSETHC